MAYKFAYTRYEYGPKRPIFGLNKLPRGSRILDVGCGIGGSSRILAEEYGFDVVGITISSEQVKRARQLKNLRLKLNLMSS